MNEWVIAIGAAFLLAGFTKMNDWIDTHLPWLPWVFVYVGILIIITGIFWDTMFPENLPPSCYFWLVIIVGVIGIGIIIGIQRRKKPREKRESTTNAETIQVLSAEAKELVVDARNIEIEVTFLILNKSSQNISPVDFMGSAKLDASTVSKDLKLVNFISSYHFKQYDTKILVRFTIQPKILSELWNKKRQNQKAHWSFNLDWNLQFPSGLQLPWKPTDIRFEQIPRIGNV